MIANVLGMELRFPTEVESAALGAAFQGVAAVAGVGVREYVEGREMGIEECVMVPTDDDGVLEAYREGRQRFKDYATRLNSN